MTDTKFTDTVRCKGDVLTLAEAAEALGLSRSVFLERYRWFGGSDDVMDKMPHSGGECCSDPAGTIQSQTRPPGSGLKLETVENRSWVGCTFLTFRTDAQNGFNSWNVVKELPDGVIAKCFEGEDKYLWETWYFRNDNMIVTEDYLPTPEEIERAREEIKRGWSQEEKESRYMETSREVSVDVVRNCAKLSKWG